MRKLNKKKIFILILLCLLIVITIVFSILYKKNNSVRAFFDEYIFRKNVQENNLPKINIENNNNVFAFNNHILYLEKNKLQVYDSSANESYSLDLEISNPIFKANGKFLCVAERNGKKIYLISGKNIIWQTEVEGNINNISLNKNGYVAVSILDTTYKTVCKLYNETGNELFTTYFAKSYIIDSAISNDNKNLALAETNSSGITVQSNVKILSLEKAILNSTDAVEFSYVAPIGDLIINIDYCDNKLLCLYDNHTDVINNSTVSEVSNYNNSNIIFADINEKLIQIEKHSDNMFSSEFELQIINANDLSKTSYSLNKEPKSVKVFGNIISINLGTEALFINTSGWLIKQYTSSQEIYSIVLSNDIAGIVYKNKVEFLNL